MCFIKIKINGVRYPIAKGEKVVAEILQELTAVKSDLSAARNEVSSLTKENHKYKCQNGQLKAEIDKLQEQLADSPARSKSGKFVKRGKAAKVESPKAE